MVQSSWERGRGSVHLERAFLTLGRKSGARKASTETVHRCLGERGNSCDLKPQTREWGRQGEEKEAPG